MRSTRTRIALALAAALAASPAAALTCGLSSTGASFGTVPVGAIYQASTSGTLNLICAPGQAYTGTVQVCLTGIAALGIMVSGAPGGALPYSVAINASGKSPSAGACALTTTTSYSPTSGANLSIPLYLKTRTATTGMPVGSYSDQFSVTATLTTPAGAALWSGASLFPVTAALQPSCALATPSLAFGSVTAWTAAQASANLAVACTPSTAYQIFLDAGRGSGASYAQRYLTGPSDTLSYNLYQDSAHTRPWDAGGYAGIGTGSAQSIGIYGLLPAQRKPAAGVYTDSVIVTLTY